MADGLRGEILVLFAVANGLDPLEPRVAKVLTLNPRQRASLLGWAPYAAKHAPELLAKDDRIPAYVFAGLFALSIFGGTRELKALAPEKKVDPAQEPAHFTPTEPVVPDGLSSPFGVPRR
jgi:hypothetical protein